ncbi:MAG: SAM-dependent chlorinase/fluorinase [Pseudomonadota bacterium]
MIVLFSDFGVADPYVGQVKARLSVEAPGQLVVDLLHQAPDFNAHAGAHLLAALAAGFPPGSVFLSIVDPGVGTERHGAVVTAGGHWYVGPDNGLLSVVAGRDIQAKIWKIEWKPESLSSTFHGRDLFAVIAAEIARGEFPKHKLTQVDKLQVEFDTSDLERVIYIDHYGNAFTGIRATAISPLNMVSVRGMEWVHGETFGRLARGQGFWFSNSAGLLELAVNRGSAAADFGLQVGDVVAVLKPS